LAEWQPHCEVCTEPRPHLTIAPARSRSRGPRIAIWLSLAALLALAAFTFFRLRRDHWRDVAAAREYLDHGRPDLALAAVSRISDEGPGAAEGLTVAAQALLMRGRIAQARRALERSLAINLDQGDAAKMLAAIYLSAGDSRRGLVLLKKAAELDSGDFRPWFAMGKVYHDMGQLPESAEAYTQALSRSPPPAEATEARIGRVRALLDGKQAEQAAADLELLRREQPKSAQVLALAARQALELGQAETAVDLADRALNVNPDEFPAILVRARVRFLAHQAKLAIADLQKADAIKPNDVPTLQLLVLAQRSLGLTSEAAATQARANLARDRVVRMDKLSRQISKRPDDPEPRWGMGKEAMEAKMYTLAYQCFQAALDLDPGYQPARAALQALRANKDFDYQAAVRSQLQMPGKPARPGS
jgi:tetratricopeptide (TPR) repeat protein